jgi:hypothetical protein
MQSATVCLDVPYVITVFYNFTVINVPTAKLITDFKNTLKIEMAKFGI